MKINGFLTLFFSVFCPLYSSSPSIIFVHLGETIPACLFTTMKQARYLNQAAEIYLLADAKAHPHFQREGFFEEEGIVLVNADQISCTEEHRTFHEVNKIDPGITKGFWVFALERFFTLFDFMKERNFENVIHLESDSMLYVDLDELLPLFNNIRLAAPFQSRAGCIPCFVFIKDSESLRLLIDHILSAMKNYQGARPQRDVNDMQLLASFYSKSGADFMIPLPTLMPEYSRHYPKRRSVFPADNGTHLNFLSSHMTLFPGYIFDAAGLGIWINGNDRRYAPGHGPGTIHSRCLFNPGFFFFTWGKEAKGRVVPYLSFKGQSYRVVNLHFHSKMPEDYTSFRETRQNFKTPR